MDLLTPEELRAAIRTIADYPKPGVLFRDITTLLGDARAFHSAVELLARPWLAAGVNRIAGIEARGFILGGALAARLGAGFVPIRKKGKLPHATVRVAYSLEYGLDEMEMHRDRHRRHGRRGGAAVALARRARARRLLHHRSSRSRWLGEARSARSAGADDRRFPRALSAVSSAAVQITPP
jgi:hypothetical protein